MTKKSLKLLSEAIRTTEGRDLVENLCTILQLDTKTDFNRDKFIKECGL
jgi:hypothetical protein